MKDDVIDNLTVDVYSITGVKVKENVSKPDVIKGLPKGLYIVGDEKAYVR